jgi:hypothetical protein
VSPDGERRTGLGAVLGDLNTPREDGVHPIWAAVGGIRGLIDSSLPTTAFVIANVIGGLRVGIYVAVGISAVLVLIRLARRERLEQAFAGLVAVGVASLIATRLNSASGFFLPGILLQIPYALAAIVSIVIGRPLVGYVAAIVNPSFADWRSVPAVRRAAAYATAIWAAVFLVRIAVMVPLYLADASSALGVAKLAMGWPLWAIAAGASLLLFRQASANLPAIHRDALENGADQEAESARPS